MNRFLIASLSLVVAPMLFAAEPVLVSMETNKGTIMLELFPDQAPKTVENFVRYTSEGFYDGTIFHRVIKGFMIQGGGRDATMKSKPTHNPIQNEASNGLKNKKYTVAMARTGDPNSATSQFFINTVDNDGLDRPNPDGYGYAVFGKVVEGTEVVDAIESVETSRQPDRDAGSQMMSDVPAEPIVIQSMTVVSGAVAE